MGIMSSLLDGLRALEIYITFENQQVYFEYPSSAQPKFKYLNATIFDSYFFNTITNFQEQGRIQTIFQANGSFKACSPILDAGYPFAVVCLKLDSYTVTSKMTSTLNVP